MKVNVKAEQAREVKQSNVEALIEHWANVLSGHMEGFGRMPDTAEGMLEFAEALREGATMAETIALLQTLKPMPSECPNCGYDIMGWAMRESREGRW